MGMEASKNSAAFFLLFGVVMGLLISSEAYDFYVGGTNGWGLNPSEDYGRWAGRSRFQVNDTLVFKYEKGNDSVLVVKKEDYDSCNLNNPIQRFDDGRTEFKFDRSGPFYFISGAGQRCQKGQKLIIVVMAVRNNPPIRPPPSPTPSPKPPTSSPAPSPSTHVPPPSPSPVPSPVSSPSPSEAPSPSSHVPSPSEGPSPSSHVPSPSEGPSPSSVVPSPSEGPSPSSNVPSPLEAPSPSSHVPSPLEAPSPSSHVPSPSGSLSPSSPGSGQGGPAAPSPSENSSGSSYSVLSGLSLGLVALVFVAAFTN